MKEQRVLVVVATVHKNVAGAPVRALAVTWFSVWELMTGGQPEERRETEIIQTSS